MAGNMNDAGKVSLISHSQKKPNTGKLLEWVVFVLAVSGLIGLGTAMALANDTIEVKGKQPGETFTLPLYQQNGIQYFSAGVGVEEREATYPPFPVKLVFAAKGGPFVVSVAVTIVNQQNGDTLMIPPEQVTGPWLFVDLKPGTYTITARRSNGDSVQRVVIITTGQPTQLAYFHWPRL